MQGEANDLSTYSETGIDMGALTQTLGEVWDGIREHHPDCPPAVVIVSSGVERGRLVKLGHWARASWQTTGTGAAKVVGEVVIASEALKNGPDEVLHTLLHEAAHALCHARGIKDHSRQGRYHNARYKEAAVEVGLRCEKMDPFGWAGTSITDALREKYAAEVSMLSMCLSGHRLTPKEREQVDREEGRGDEHDEAREKARKARKNRQRHLLECGCDTPRKIRVSPSVADLGPIVCGLCNVPFRRVVDDDDGEAEGEEGESIAA